MTIHYIPEWVRLIGKENWNPIVMSYTYRVIAYNSDEVCVQYRKETVRLPWDKEGTSWKRTSVMPGSLISIEVTP